MRLPFFIKFVQDRKEHKNYGKYNFTAYQLQQKPYWQDFHTIPSLTRITFHILYTFAGSYYS